jgi:hypothetical protein
MALNWSSVTPEHVKAALVLVSKRRASDKVSGLVVRHEGRTLPAKEVLRAAYLLANQMPESADVRFASGDGTLTRLQRLGFEAWRCSESQSQGDLGNGTANS